MRRTESQMNACRWGATAQAHGDMGVDMISCRATGGHASADAIDTRTF